MKLILKKLNFMGLIVLSLFCMSQTLASDLNKTHGKYNAQQIVDNASLSSYYGGNDGRSMARMRIVDANGRTQIRQFTLLRKDISDGGQQKFLVVFSHPADIRGTVFMVHKNIQKDDDRWLYLPGLDLVKRISAGDKRTSFVGAHYFYEDVSGRSPKEDKHEIISENEQYYILKHTPINPVTVEFSYYKTWIDKTNFLPHKIEYFDESNKAFKLIETIKVEVIQSIPTVTEAKVTNLNDNSYTLIEFRGMTYDIGLPDELFNERALRNPPAKWLHAR